MATSTLEISLIEWLAKLNSTTARCESLHDLTSGEIINQVILEILEDSKLCNAPALPTGDWLDHKRFWLNIIERLSEYMVKKLGTISQTLEEQMESLQSLIDVESLSRGTSTASLVPLLEVLLSACVQSKLKENCIMQIMQLRKDQQTSLMASIQNTMKRFQKKVVAPSTKPAAPATSKIQAPVDYKAKYYQLKASKEALQDSMNLAQNKLENLTDSHIQLIRTVTELESCATRTNEENKQLKSQLEDMKGQAQGLYTGDSLDMDSPMRFKSSSKVSADENTALKTQLMQQEQLVSSLQKQLSALSPYVTRSRELEDELEMLKEKLQGTTSMERVSRKLDSKNMELNTALTKIKQLEEHVVAAQKSSSEHETLTKQVPLLKSKMDKYKSEIVSLHSSMTESGIKLQRQEVELHLIKEEVGGLMSQLEQANEIAASLEKENRELQTALLSRPKQTNSATTIAKTSLAAQTGLTTTSGLNRGRNDANLQQLEKNLSEVKDEKEALKMDFEDQLDTMARIRDKYQQDYITTADALRTVANEKNGLETQVNRLKQEFAGLELSKTQSEAQLSSEVQTVTLSLENSRCTIISLEAEKESLLVKQRSLESVISQLTQTLAEQTNSETSHAQEREILSKQVRQTTDKYNGVLSEVESLGKELQSCKQELQDSLKHVEEVSVQLATQQDEYHELASKIGILENEKSDLTSQISSMEIESASLEETLQEFMTRELEAVESTLALKNEVQMMQAVIESRDAELEYMQTELEKAKINEALLGVISKLKLEVNGLKRQLAAKQREQQAVAAAFHAMGLELYKLRLGGLPESPTTELKVSQNSFTCGSGFQFETQKLKAPSPLKAKRVPLKERTSMYINILPVAMAAIGKETSPKETRRMTMAQRALQTRPRGFVVSKT